MMNGDRFKHLNHLVLNCYPDGYSIAVKLNEFPVFTSETILETAKISYEESSLLDYIENEELPPLLVEMIDRSPKLSQYRIWHNGCLILEVRDKTNIEIACDPSHRTNSKGLQPPPSPPTQPQTTATTNNHISDHQYSRNGILSASLNGREAAPAWKVNHSNRNKLLQPHHLHHHHQADDNFCDPTTDDSSLSHNQEELTATMKSSSNNNSFFILLKPTNISMLNDVVSLTDSQLWTTQDRLQLESQIVLHNSPPLFLEPDASKQPSPAQDSNPFSKACNTTSTTSRNKKRLPHKKLVSAQRRSSSASKYSSAYYYNKCMNQKNNNQSGRNHNNNINSNGGNGGTNNKNNIHKQYDIQAQQDSVQDQILPPELNLQQFLAAKRAKRKSFAAGHLAKFYRHKRPHSLNN